MACGRRATDRGHFGIRHCRHQCARDRLPSRGRVMSAHPLPDGRVPVLLSAHDETLISQDARAILDYLDRAGEDNDPTLAIASTLLRLRRVRRHRAVVRASDRGELVAALSALACGDEHPLVARSSKSGGLHIAFVFPGQGNQWPSMGSRCLPTAAGLPGGGRPMRPGVRRGRAAVSVAVPDWGAAAGLVADRDSGSAVHPRGQFGRPVAIPRNASRRHRGAQPWRSRSGVCGRNHRAARCGRFGRRPRRGRRPVDRVATPWRCSV